MKPLLRTLKGTTDNYSFERRLYHGMVIFGLAGTLGITVADFIYNMYTETAYRSLLLAIGMFVCMSVIFVFVYFLRKSYDAEKEGYQRQEVLLKKKSNQKSMFFINLSHQIRPPLTLAGNYIEKYIDRKGEDKELVMIRQYIQIMRRDILGYLDFEKFERGIFIDDKPEVFLMGELLEEKITIFKCYADHKNIILNYNIESDVYIKANPKGAGQVLNNILENAVLYTPEHGEINVNLKNEEDVVKLIVQNSGTGIPPVQIGHLFEPFYQLPGEKQNIHGIGMGLYIVKKILDNTGGQIEVNSSKESGTVFTITFPEGTKGEVTPLQVSSTITPVITKITSKVSDSAYSVKKPCLLIVEDQNDLLGYLVDELSTDYNIFVADNGLTAVNRLETIPVPELIISDIMMDQMDGNELLEKTRADERFAHIPFIFLTAKDTIEEKISGLASGALDVVAQPFSMGELKMKIKTIICQKERISEAAFRQAKKQFTDGLLIKRKQEDDEMLNENAIKYNLTVRERELITYIRQGLIYEEIGEKLHISRNTVIRHMQNMYRKIGVSSKLELIDKLSV
jgi:two-component system, sensor histidine kinase ChiS